MLGPAVNAIVIVVCGLLGSFLIRGIPPRFEKIITKALGLCTLFIGIKGALENQHGLLLVMSMVIGTVLGELINIDALMNRLGAWAERRLGMGNSAASNEVAANSEVAASSEAGGIAQTRSFSKGFVTASILFCTGSMAIVGSMQSGLVGNHEILFTKSILDGSISIVFGASLGVGVVFSAVPVFVYQAGIALASMAVKEFLTPDIIREMSAVGSLIIAAIGFNFLGLKEEIKVANFIPAIFIPLVYLTVEGLLKA